MSDPDALAACLAGDLPPALALSRLLLAGVTPDDLRRRIDAARREDAAWRDLDGLADPARLARLARLLAAVDHAGPTTTERVAALFDRAAAVSPEASVALYSLGDPALLDAATAELVAWLRPWLRPDHDVLDLGCGIGRIAGAIARDVRSVLGLDVSTRMIALARARTAEARNTMFTVTDGAGLGALPAGFDLVLAVDSLPYLAQAGVLERHMDDIHRLLRPGGALLAFNLLYADAASETALAWRLAGRRFALAPAGRPFRQWDATVFAFRKR